MRPSTIRLIDFWIGVPLCWLLTLWRSLVGDRPAPSVRKLVFLKFIEQGATVLAHDAITRATALVGRDHVYFCVFESNRAILDLLDTVPRSNIIAIRDRTLATCLLDFVRAARCIRVARVDTSVDMEFFSRASAIFGFLSGASTRIGLHRFTSELPYRGDLMTHRVQYTPYLHVSTQYSLLTAAIGSDPKELPLLKVPSATVEPRAPLPVFEPSEGDRSRLHHYLRGQQSEAQLPAPIIVLNPNASDLLPLRKWPGDRFVDLAHRLLAAYPGAFIVVTGGNSERAAAEALRDQIGSPRVISMAGLTTLRELLTLYAYADVLVTNDSGPAHFAALTAVAVVVLFGPETPALFGPLSPRSRVIWKQLACSPCVSVFNHRFSPCTNNICMQSIEVDEVFNAVSESLRSVPGASRPTM